jgi:hypothetical protein
MFDHKEQKMQYYMINISLAGLVNCGIKSMSYIVLFATYPFCNFFCMVGLLSKVCIYLPFCSDILQLQLSKCGFKTICSLTSCFHIVDDIFLLIVPP